MVLLCDFGLKKYYPFKFCSSFLPFFPTILSLITLYTFYISSFLVCKQKCRALQHLWYSCYCSIFVAPLNENIPCPLPDVQRYKGKLASFGIELTIIALNWFVIKVNLKWKYLFNNSMSKLNEWSKQLNYSPLISHLTGLQS